jgi:hypothetical protein
MSHSHKKLKELRRLEQPGADGTASSWQSLKDCLVPDGWAEPGPEYEGADGPSLVGERVYVMGYGPGFVEGFHPVKIGQSKHSILLDDGPRTEKVVLRRRGNGKVPWLVKSVMTTSYRRKRNGLTHREPWSSNPRTLSRALTSDEANKMWTSFDEKLGSDHELFRRMDARGNVLPRSNSLDDSNPDQPMGLKLQSSGTRTPRRLMFAEPAGAAATPASPASPASPAAPAAPAAPAMPRLGAMRGRMMSQSAPQLGCEPAVFILEPAHIG